MSPTLNQSPSLRSVSRIALAAFGTAALMGLAVPAPSAVTQEPREEFRRFDRDGGISFEERRAFLKSLGEPQEGPPLAESVRVVENIPYAGTEGRRQRLDLLLPRKPRDAGPLPVILFVHGGGWRGGDRRSGFSALGPLVANGEYAGVTVGYRLTGDATWPAQIHDCKAAVRWVRANASKYNLDPDRIGAMGPSAGGHLVAMLGTSGGVAALEGDVGPYRGVSSRVRCVADLYGPADLNRMGLFPSAIDHDAADSPEGLLIGGPIPENQDAARAASPTTYASPDDPPFLIVHGTRDEIVPFDQSVRLTEALRREGVEATLIPVERAGHGNFGNPELPLRIQAFFDKHLRGQDVSVSDAPLPVGEAPKRRRPAR